MPSPDLQQAQRRIDEIQSLYRQWLRLLPALQAAQRQWRQAEEIMAELDAFYARDYLPLRDAAAGGLALSQTTEGEYGVLSEDALFDAFSDRHRLAWQWLRLATAALDPENQAVADAPQDG